MVAVIIAAIVSLGILVPASANAAATYSVSGHVYLGDVGTSAGAGEVTVTIGDYRSEQTPVATTQTDVGGNYLLPGLATGSYWVYFAYNGVGPFSSMLWPDKPYGVGSWLSINAADLPQTNMTLTRAAAISGLVGFFDHPHADTAGQVSVRYSVYQRDKVWSPESAGVLTTTGGAYSLPGLVAGVYRLHFVYVGTGNYQSLYLGSSASKKAAQLITFSAGQDLIQQSMSMWPKQSVSGTAFLGTTAVAVGVGDVDVTCSYYDADLAEWVPIAGGTTTDANGHYSFSDLPDSGLYRVSFTYTRSAAYFDGSTDTSGSVADTNARADVILVPALSVEGHVDLGDSAHPAGADEVTAFLLYRDAGQTVVSSAPTDSAGNFSIPDVPAGSYTLVLEYSGAADFPDLYYPATLYQSESTALVVPAAGVSGLVFTMPPGGEVSGTVISSSGQPVAGVTVDALGYFPAGSPQAGQFADFRETTTDAAGKYSFVGLPAAGYEIDFTNADTFANQSWPGKSYRYTQYSYAPTVLVARGQVRVGINATLLHAASLSGQILLTGVSRNGSFGAQVEVLDDANNWVVSSASTQLASDGIYRFSGLAPGRYRVLATYSEWFSGSHVESPTLTLTEGMAGSFSTTIGMGRGSRGGHDFTGDTFSDVLATTPGGALYVYPGNGSGSWQAPSVIGSGWNGMTSLVPVGDFDGDGFSDILGRTSGGALYLYSGSGNKGWTSAHLVGSGWNGMTAVLSAGDFNGDGNQDVLGQTAAGALYLYAGNGHGSWTSTTVVGSGWQGMTAILSPGDFDGDGYPDVIARAGNGNLYLYPGNGHGGWGTTRLIGSGWNGMSAIVSVGDFDGDGNADVLGRTVSGALYLYRGNGLGGWGAVSQIGSGWSGFATIS
ncbi:FG-GAP-like repeat-containing protein [Lacisediminihabitans sp. H27-G8]|uniref:FG-GAP-like repeat-containing protein n=1 Tax=Lacisediminihabitans sp. H27-G8 TaxID=3111909 RepID=UPI0038FC0D53